MSEPLRMSVHAVDRYCERVLHWPAGKVAPAEFEAAAREMRSLCRRVIGVDIPRFVIRFHHFSFVVVRGTVVTVLEPRHRAWIGRFSPNHQTEILLND